MDSEFWDSNESCCFCSLGSLAAAWGKGGVVLMQASRMLLPSWCVSLLQLQIGYISTMLSMWVSSKEGAMFGGIEI